MIPEAMEAKKAIRVALSDIDNENCILRVAKEVLGDDHPSTIKLKTAIDNLKQRFFEFKNK